MELSGAPPRQSCPRPTAKMRSEKVIRILLRKVSLFGTSRIEERIVKDVCDNPFTSVIFMLCDPPPFLSAVNQAM